ncbi:MAG: hypothetical protein EBR02_01315 [Alphaproteobacteria bacterium]|nr:hypothetical protein [Alphaproteobacteria bacterium]
MTTNIPPQLDTQNSADINQIRQQLAIMQNVLVSLNGVEGNSRLASLVERSIGGIADSTLEENNDGVSPARRGRRGRKKSSLVNGLIKYTRRQVVSQLSSAVKRAILRDL